MLEEREQEVKDLADKLEELGAAYHERTDDLEDALRQVAERDAEMEALTDDLKKVSRPTLVIDVSLIESQLGARVFELEEELGDRTGHAEDMEAEVEAIEKELEGKQAVHEQVVVALKEVGSATSGCRSIHLLAMQKLSESKARVGDIQTQYEAIQADRAQLRDQIERLATRTAELEEKSRADADMKRRLEEEREDLSRALKSEQTAREREIDQLRRAKRDAEARANEAITAKDIVGYVGSTLARADNSSYRI